MIRLALLCLHLLGLTSVAADDRSPELLDLNGKLHRPLSVADRKGVVLFFVSPFCPTSNALTPEANKIAAEYGDRFAFYFVEADSDIAQADAVKHASTFEIQAPVLLDPKQALVRHTSATTTPETAVIGGDGKILYQGRINDLYLGQTRKQKAPKSHDLRVALDAIASGQEVPAARTKAIGCSITLP